MKTTMRVVAAAGLLLLCGAAPTPEDAVVGLWPYRVSYPVGLKGELVLSHTGSRWHGAIGGAAADGTQTGREVRIAFPNDGGVFRGTFEHGALRGFWVRRQVTDDPNFPLGQSLNYAGVLDLKTAGADRWHAKVVPLQDTFTLYLKIFSDADGTLKAAFRNPELHSHGGAMWFAVTRGGDALHFSAKLDDGDVTHDATLLHGPDRIAIRWDDLKKTIELRRVSPMAAAHFFPRAPGSAPYVYRMPAKTGDGWPVTRARNVGMDEAKLAAAVQRIADIDPTSVRAWLIHSMAIARHVKLVLDEYFYGFGRDDVHDTRSASKTFSAIILGALMRDGMAISTNSRMVDMMAPLTPFANPDPRKDRITLGHLMTHSAGLACDDNAEHSPGNEDVMEADAAHPDWTRRTLDLPMQYEPGVHYAYCSMNINIAGAMLSRASGEWLPALFDRTVARPLGFGPYYWNLQGSGEGYLGGGVFLRPRDFMKIGQAYLDGGVWNWAPHRNARMGEDLNGGANAYLSPATTGVDGDAFRNNYYDTGEGFAWHLLTVKSGDKSYPCGFANGNGGQLLIVVPQFDLVAMFTAGNYGQGVWNRERDDILGGMIIPAILDQAGVREGR